MQARGRVCFEVWNNIQQELVFETTDNFKPDKPTLNSTRHKVTVSA
jgi:hypothetical protein